MDHTVDPFFGIRCFTMGDLFITQDFVAKHLDHTTPAAILKETFSPEKKKSNTAATKSSFLSFFGGATTNSEEEPPTQTNMDKPPPGHHWMASLAIEDEGRLMFRSRTNYILFNSESKLVCVTIKLVRLQEVEATADPFEDKYAPIPLYQRDVHLSVDQVFRAGNIRHCCFRGSTYSLRVAYSLIAAIDSVTNDGQMLLLCSLHGNKMEQLVLPEMLLNNAEVCDIESGCPLITPTSAAAVKYMEDVPDLEATVNCLFEAFKNCENAHSASTTASFYNRYHVPPVVPASEEQVPATGDAFEEQGPTDQDQSAKAVENGDQSSEQQPHGNSTGPPLDGDDQQSPMAEYHDQVAVTPPSSPVEQPPPLRIPRTPTPSAVSVQLSVSPTKKRKRAPSDCGRDAREEEEQAPLLPPPSDADSFCLSSPPRASSEVSKQAFDNLSQCITANADQLDAGDQGARDSADPEQSVLATLYEEVDAAAPQSCPREASEDEVRLQSVASEELQVPLSQSAARCISVAVVDDLPPTPHTSPKKKPPPKKRQPRAKKSSAQKKPPKKKSPAKNPKKKGSIAALLDEMFADESPVKVSTTDTNKKPALLSSRLHSVSPQRPVPKTRKPRARKPAAKNNTTPQAIAKEDPPEGRPTTAHTIAMSTSTDNEPFDAKSKATSMLQTDRGVSEELCCSTTNAAPTKQRLRQKQHLTDAVEEDAAVPLVEAADGDVSMDLDPPHRQPPPSGAVSGASPQFGINYAVVRRPPLQHGLSSLYVDGMPTHQPEMVMPLWEQTVRRLLQHHVVDLKTGLIPKDAADAFIRTVEGYLDRYWVPVVTEAYKQQLASQAHR